MLPNTLWTGEEIDLLVVHKTLRVIDVEIKISRADLKADASKARWWVLINGGQRRPVEYPRHVWKHYVVMPRPIWRPEFDNLLQPISGVILVDEPQGRRATSVRNFGVGSVQCIRRAVPNRAAKPLDAEHVLAIARLASLRMWDAMARAET